jgi:polysaccharide biosynthesis/export protein
MRAESGWLKTGRSTPAGLSRALTGALLALIVAVTAACTVPRSAALPSEILRETRHEESDFHVVPVTRAAMTEIATWPRTAGATRHQWLGAGGLQPGTRPIRAGDVLTISIWDSQRDSLLTAEQERVVDLQNVAVSPSGRIFVPYVGEFAIAGMTSEQARRELQQLMTPIVPDAQVQLAVLPGPANAVDVVAGVARPGRYPITETSPTLMGVLAEAGGIPPDLRNPLVRLQRGGRSFAIPAQELLANPAYDTVLRGGDRIVVEPDRRHFIALGATGRQDVVEFAREEITALDALSSIGGLTERRANVRGVMILREYPASALRPAGGGPPKPWVIFTFDLATADGLFAARNFRVEPADVVLATEASLPMVTTAFALFRSVRTLGG